MGFESDVFIWGPMMCVLHGCATLIHVCVTGFGTPNKSFLKQNCGSLGCQEKLEIDGFCSHLLSLPFRLFIPLGPSSFFCGSVRRGGKP